MNKKVITIGAAVLVGLSLAACGNSKSDNSDSSSKTTSSKKAITHKHKDKKSNSSSSTTVSSTSHSSVTSESSASDSSTSDSETTSSASSSTSSTANKINSGAEAINYLKAKGAPYNDVEWSVNGPQKDDDGNVFYACGGDTYETIELNKQNGTDSHDHMDTWVYADGRLRNPYSGEWVN